MAEYIKRLWHSLQEQWHKKNRSQRIFFLSVSAGILMVFIVVFFFFSKPNYVPLYNNLDLNEAGEITKKLDGMKVKYELADAGKTILVPPENKYKARIELAQEGLPRGGLDFNDVMDKTRLGTTEWEKQLQYNQALQGELTRTIESLEEVEAASIHIVQEEKGSFLNLDKTPKPTAAVVLSLSPGSHLKDEQVLGIINIISHSVRGLDPERVSIIDNYGRILSNVFKGSDNTDELINAQLAIQNNLQKELQVNVQTLLEQIYGIGNVVVRVNAQINFDKKVVESRIFSPVNEDTGEGILLSTQEYNEHSSGTTTTQEGVPGVDGNVLPTYQQPTQGENDYSRSEITRNYEINETLENLNIAPGAIEKISVSVVINKDLNEGEKTSIANMVARSVGSNPQEDITVEGVEFSTDFVKSLQDVYEAEQRQNMIRNLIFSGLILLAIVVILLVIRTLLRRRRQKEEDLVDQMILTQEEAAASGPLEDEIEEDRIFAEIQKYARRRPEDIAKLLRAWLEEE